MRHGRSRGPLVRLAAVLPVAVAIASGVTTGHAVARAARPPLTLPARFTRVGSGELIGGERRSLVFNPQTSTGLLIDGTTGRRTRVSVPGCAGPAAISATTIVFGCGTGAGASYQLYDIATGRLRPLELNSSLAPGCAPLTPSCLQITGVGADWVSVLAPCDEDEQCAESYSLENLATGAVVPDPTSATTAIDLDVASGGRRLCHPVTVPPNAQDIEGGRTPFGSVASAGRFQIATSNAGSFLDQCGVALHQFLTYTSYPGCAHQTCSPPVSPHMIVWESKPGRLSGVFVPSLRRFTIAVPRGVDPQARQDQFVNGHEYGLALTAHSVYLAIGRVVWTATVPASPPSAEHRQAASSR
jgi:hypothetical protein